VFVARPYSFPTSAPPPALAPAPRPRRADPGCAVAVAATLVDYLAARLGVPGLAYAARPAPVGDGWEGYLYSFQLHGVGLPAAAGLRATWDRPLVLRIRASPAALPQARREEEVPRFLSRLRYPVAAPLLLEEDCGHFGGPFLIMEQVPGQPLLQVMLEQPWNVLHFPARMAEAHARFRHCLCLGPEASGCKPSLVDHLNGDCLAGLCDDFRRWTAVEVRP
jgi:hypothetical protein